MKAIHKLFLFIDFDFFCQKCEIKPVNFWSKLEKIGFNFNNIKSFDIADSNESAMQSFFEFFQNRVEPEIADIICFAGDHADNDLLDNIKLLSRNPVVVNCGCPEISGLKSGDVLGIFVSKSSKWLPPANDRDFNEFVLDGIKRSQNTPDIQMRGNVNPFNMRTIAINNG